MSAGDKWFVLKIGCPACEEGKDSPSTWVHAEDSRLIEINGFAEIRCRGGHKWKFSESNWDCSRHHGEYRPADPSIVSAMLTRAMRMMKGFTEEDVPNDWLFALIGNLTLEFKLNPTKK